MLAPGGAHAGPSAGGTRLLPQWVRGACAQEQSEGPTHLLPPSLLQPGSESTSYPQAAVWCRGGTEGRGWVHPGGHKGLGKTGRRTRHGD